jgi:hypothetical protein
MTLEIFNVEQGTPEWFAARLGIPTASQFHTVMAKGKGGASKTRETYLFKLIGERMTGELMDNFNNAHMERGHRLELEARDAYAVKTDTWPEPVGFLRRGRVGCSPDSLVNEDGMVEIKTKLPHLQLAVLFGEELPPGHKAQCQGQLWIAERDWVDFVSYYPNTPPFILRVNRDEEYIAEIQIAVEEFLTEMDERMALIEKQFGKGWFAPKAPRPRVDPDKEFTDVEE